MCSALELIISKSFAYAEATGKTPGKGELIAWLNECQGQGDCTDPPKRFKDYSPQWQRRLEIAAWNSAHSSPRFRKASAESWARREKIDSHIQAIVRAMSELTKLGVSEADRLRKMGEAMRDLEREEEAAKEEAA